MIQSLFHSSTSATVLERAITDVAKSIAKDRLLLQKTQRVNENIKDYISVNNPAKSIIQKATRLQTLMENRLQHIEKLLQKIENLYGIDISKEWPESAEDIEDHVELEE